MSENFPKNLFNDPDIEKRDALLQGKRQRKKESDISRKCDKASLDNEITLDAEEPFSMFISNAYEDLNSEIEEQMTDADGYATLSLELKRKTYNDLAEKFIKYGPKKTGLVLHDFFKQIYDTYKTAEQDVDVINYFLEKIGNDIRVMVVEKTENYKMIYKIDNAR